jgi:ABC-2 type transport system permease protein
MTAELATFPKVTGFLPIQYAICLKGIVWREGLRFLHQHERFVAALVRPLVWLFIFAAGFRQVSSCSMACSPRCPWSTIAKWATCARCS